MTDIVPSRSTLAVSPDQSFWDERQLAALRQIGIQDAPPADLAVFLNFAQRTGLDPFARQIYMIGRNQKSGNGWTTKWTIQASIDGLRIVAERSGDYAGQVGPEFCGSDGNWTDVWVKAEPPVAARVGVLRHKFTTPLYAVAYFDEYVQTDRDGNPTSMWKSKPLLMLAKCAEALALRKAFPNDLAGLYTADEMGASENHTPRIAPAPSLPIVQDPTPTIVQDQDLNVDIVTGEIVDEAPSTPPHFDQEQVTERQLKAIGAILNKCGVKDRTQRHLIVERIVDHPYNDAEDLTKAEGIKIIEFLNTFTDQEDPPAALANWSATISS